MASKKFRWWMLLIPVLLAAVGFTVIFWDAILIRIAPKAVLTTALTDVFSQLEARFRDDPLLILAKAIEPEGKYTADIDLNATNDLLGPVNYNMVVQTNGTNHQLYADGFAAATEMQLDLSWYMDTEFMAVSSNDLVSGKYYGITYDTFSEDIRSIPLLNFFISDRILSQWDTSIQSIQAQISHSYTLPQIPEISETDIQKLLLGILALPCEIEHTSISVDTSFLDCHAISYQASGEQVDKILAGTPYSEAATVTATFYLYENTLVKVTLKCASGNQSVLYSLGLGLTPSEGVIHLQGIKNNHGVFDDFMLTVDTQHIEDSYIESWNISQTADGNTQESWLNFKYQLSSGALEIIYNETDEPINLILKEKDNGFQIKTDDFAPLVHFFTQSNVEMSSANQISCTMEVTKGSQITTPAYKNLDQWSLEDFWTLLSGVGSLIGIQIQP